MSASDLVLTTGTTPAAPPAGTASIYPKADGLFYTQDDTGTETPLKGATGATGAAGTGFPTGGLTGQILKKNSGTDYDTSWVSVLAAMLTNTGSLGAATGILAAGGITPANVNPIECQYIAGSGGAVTVTATTPIANGATVGQILILYGTSDTNTVTLSNGTHLSMNGDITLGLDDMVALLWNGTYWNEIARRR